MDDKRTKAREAQAGEWAVGAGGVFARTLRNQPQLDTAKSCARGCEGNRKRSKDCIATFDTEWCRFEKSGRFEREC